MQQARKDEGDAVQEVRRVQAGPGETQVKRSGKYRGGDGMEE